MSETYDCIIIGAGMSGLASGIRLAMFDKKVCILESHSIAGGLNSYYSRGGYNLDVGLHALTNFATKGNKKGPLGKLLKQLRIPYDDFQLKEQINSKVKFSDAEFNFNNDRNFLFEEIKKTFPHEIDSFLKLVSEIETFNELDYGNKYESAKNRVALIIKDPLLIEMIFCPLLIYGSAWEDDMDYSQFVIMFKSIFLEGFSRPEGGVRTIINLLIEKYKILGGELRFRAPVEEILTENNRAIGVRLKNGEVLKAKKILSSAGYPETFKLTGRSENIPIGKMGFTESIALLDKKPSDFGIKDTIIFYNEGPKYNYRTPDSLYDPKSAVICFSNNFQDDKEEYGIYRVTQIANYDKWMELDRQSYKDKKEEVFKTSLSLLHQIIPPLDGKLLLKDIFTPKTVKKFTRHERGCVYGSPQKLRDGKTAIEDLYLCGTDQGFLGVIGSMLSGISMANLHVLMD